MKIIRDTREKDGWNFEFYDNIEITSQKMDCGDYTTDVLKDIIVIERKASVVEIANNLGKKVAKDRFYREFDRMASLKKAYIVCQFLESDVYGFPQNSGLSQAKIAMVRMNGKNLIKMMAQITREYDNIEIIF